MKGKTTNYKLLLKLMVPIGLILCWAAYQMSFKHTLESYRSYSALSDAGTVAEPLSVSPAYSQSRDAVITRLYKRYQVDTATWKNLLWNHCATLSQKFDCTVDGFPYWKHAEFGQTPALEQEVSFSGSFHNLLRLQHALDTISAIGLTASLNYSHNPRTNRTSLKIQLIALDKHKYL